MRNPAPAGCWQSHRASSFSKILGSLVDPGFYPLKADRYNSFVSGVLLALQVNEMLGKPLFDCRRVMERWRDGPADGESCD